MFEYTILPSLSPETMYFSKFDSVIACTVFLCTVLGCWNPNLDCVFHSRISPLEVPVIKRFPPFIHLTAKSGCCWRC